MGRPMKLSEERTEMITNAISEGATLETACRLGGITLRTFERWVNRGEEALEKDKKDRSELDVKLIEFRRKVYHARVSQRKTLEDTIFSAATGEKSDWRAALAYLERQYPGSWSKKNVIEHQGSPAESMGWADENEIKDAEVTIVEDE